jgi:hypothetical protein
VCTTVFRAALVRRGFHSEDTSNWYYGISIITRDVYILQNNENVLGRRDAPAPARDTSD